jgi:putative SOS response-associated peptidase YedK
MQGKSEANILTSTPADRLKSLLVPFANDGLEAYAVSPHVNSPKNDDPQCVERIE